MIKVFSFAEAGGHAVNEDAFLVVPHPQKPGCLLCALADGQGGSPGGGPAAHLACRTCINLATTYPPDELVQPKHWATILHQADRAVHDDPAAGFTTLVALAVRGEQLAGASSGDSAVVATVPGRRAVVLTAGQLKNPPVGSGEAFFVPFAASLVSPWTVLAMSDGVWKYAGWEAVLAVEPHQPGEEVVAALQKRARLPGSERFPDDFTLVVLQNAERDE